MPDHIHGRSSPTRCARDSGDDGRSPSAGPRRGGPRGTSPCPSCSSSLSACCCSSHLGQLPPLTLVRPPLRASAAPDPAGVVGRARVLAACVAVRCRSTHPVRCVACSRGHAPGQRRTLARRQYRGRAAPPIAPLGPRRRSGPSGRQAVTARRGRVVAGRGSGPMADCQVDGVEGARRREPDG